jgi:hypothetical protein
MTNTEEKLENRTPCANGSGYVEMQVRVLTSMLPDFMIRKKIYDINDALLEFIEEGNVTGAMRKVFCNYGCPKKENCKCPRYDDIITGKDYAYIFKNHSDYVYKEIQKKGGRPYLIKASKINPDAQERATSIEKIIAKIDLNVSGPMRFTGAITKYSTQFSQKIEIYVPHTNSIVDVKEPLALLTNFQDVIQESKPFTLKVEGENPDSENIALTLYSAFTDGNHNNVGTNRFTNQEK